ncbi:MAG: HigA family addiction module antitoxin [Thermodesulfovibrionales bacterium]
MAINDTPYKNIGPGEFIKEELEVRNWRQEDLAEILGISLKTVNQLIKNKQTITIETAKLLSKAFGQSPQYWINLDSNYRLRRQEDTRQTRDAEIKGMIYKYMPVTEMVKKGWLSAFRNSNELIDRVYNFWDINKLDFTFLDNAELPTFRKSDVFAQYNKYYALTWFRMAQTSAQNYSSDQFGRDDLRQLAVSLYSFTVKPNGIELFLNELSNAGVKFFILSHLQKTYIDGASFWDKSNPVIVYSGRYNRIDNFWFTVAHEIAHILLHLKKKTDYFIDDLDNISSNVEKEANQYATKLLRANEITAYFKHFGNYISEKRVVDCSKELNVSPAIVVGVLHHSGLLSRRNLNRYKEKVFELIPETFLAEKRLEKKLRRIK